MKPIWLIPVLCALRIAVGAVPVKVDPAATPRERYGASQLEAALESPGVRLPSSGRILAGVRRSPLFSSYSGLPNFSAADSEAFHLGRAGKDWLVVGSDPSGVLYGCLELANRTLAAKALPEEIDVTDRPALRIRGTNLFWMKRGDYNFPVVPKEFPWFFDRALMTRYLDELARNRYNTIFFWNGHPFPYFLRLAKYPEARMLNNVELERNIQYLKWFTGEADKRGLWTVFHFYNIHVSPNFAKAHFNEGVREENPASTPLLAAYMRYCVSEFVSSYPSVGLMLTAGEALHIRAEEYVRDVIVAGIKDTGKKPPLIVRQWWIDPERYRDIIRPSYDNLFTMMKHNTEMIVSPHPDPRHATWLSYGQSHIVNLHELGDVKPFRWGSPVWIQEMVSIWKGMGIAGFHLYPMTSWMWPEALDRTEPPLSVIDRDRIWIEAFGRYGWQPERPAADEEAFWKQRLAERFGHAEAGKAIYDYYVKTGPILPGIQNIINIYNMNYHPTAVSQEATLNGILHSDRWEGVGDYLARPLDEFTLRRYEQRYAKLPREAREQPPLSVKQFLAPHAQALEPLALADLFAVLAEESLAGLETAKTYVTRESDEYARFISDNRCILRFARFYRAKIEAAIEKGQFDSSDDPAHYERMLAKLDESVSEYRAFAKLATPAYRQATDLGDWYRWDSVAGSFEQEAAFYHEQNSVAARGAELVYLGLNGPMNNAANAFHWLVEHYRTEAGLSAQSYRFSDSPLRRAKLAIVYDLHSSQYQHSAAALSDWVQRGGRMLIWDATAGAPTDPLLDGIQFSTDTSHRRPSEFAFDAGDHVLLRGLGSGKYGVDAVCSSAANIGNSTASWTELAYTVVPSVSSRQFYSGEEPFGPRWVSLMDPARLPLALIRKYGKGEVVFAQLGSCNIPARPSAPSGLLDAAPLYLRLLARNLISWAGEAPAPSNSTAGK
jgi:hypothetical protein